MHVIATAGHVDHGKSTLVRALTGMEPDRWSEERRRGMTIDLGFAWTTTADGTTLAFVDVPGHERFVPNMLAGVGPVPAAMIVVAADEGWMPQSTEHLEALDALGVCHGLLVVTRSDLADPAPALAQARDHLKPTTLADVPSMTVSGVTGFGLEALRGALDDLGHRLPEPDRRADPRLWIDRAFTIRGSGTVVTGTLTAGRLHTGQRLVLHSTGQVVSVRGLQCLGVEEREVEAIARVALNLRGVAWEEVRRGDALVAPQRWWSTDVVDVRVRGSHAQDLPQHLMLHIGAAAIPVRLRPFDDQTARLSLNAELPLRIGDRALLRDPGSHRVPAGVTVLDVAPPALTRRGDARRRAASLAELSGEPDGTGELRRRQVVRADDLRAMGAAVPDDAASGGPWLLDPGHCDALGAQLASLLAEHRQAHPLEDGVPAEVARRELELPDVALLPTVLRSPAAHDVEQHGGRVRLGSAPLPDDVLKAVRAVRASLSGYPFAAPTADELAALGLGEKELAAAARAGHLLRLDRTLVLLPDALERAVEHLRALPSPFTLSAARQCWNTSRRVAVPLLERLGALGWTERLPDGTHRLRAGV
jgi:selenocysteine-specific elongation factor